MSIPQRPLQHPPQAPSPAPQRPPAPVSPGAAQALLGFGQVRHTRLRPTRHAFAYGTYFLMLPMRSLRAHGPGELARNRRSALSFFDADHGDGRADALAWLDELLVQHGVCDATGEVWLHTHPRVWGHTFKPVSFWYAHRADGTLAAVVAEVNNTFGERHCYLLVAPRWGQPCQADKVFHVSPFCSVQGHYRFVFMRTTANGPAAPRTVARVDLHDDQGPLVCTSVSGTLVPLTAASRRRALWRHPVMTVGVVARIHWQALQLWTKRVRWFSKPQPPADFVTR
jgi:hypothetical protein